MSIKQEAPIVVNGAMRDALVRAALDRVENPKVDVSKDSMLTAAQIARAAQRGLGQKRRHKMTSVSR
jgi:hypothetical protein